MDYFVPKDSIVREIWGKSDTILFVFAGASAEFALNKAVDWLYFTGRLPADPLGRLFSTVMYARLIVFSENDRALKAIDQIVSIHQAVEANRESTIPDWAYRDVLFMLMHYSVAAYELLERKLTEKEKDDLVDVFYRMGMRMNLKELPQTFTEFTETHARHLENDLVQSAYTKDLFVQYKKHLGAFRYRLLIDSQKLVCLPLVIRMLGMKPASLAGPLVAIYKVARVLRLDGVLKAIILPRAYQSQIRALDKPPVVSG